MMCSVRGVRRAAMLAGVSASMLGSMLACGGGGGGGSNNTVTGPATPVFTSVSVTPQTPVLYTLAPGNTVALQVKALDQNGSVMSGVAAPTFTSSDESKATVNSSGLVTAVTDGSANITASITQGGVTHTATSQVTVTSPASTANVAVSASGDTYGSTTYSFEPNKVDVARGGLVTWALGPTIHNIIFDGANGAPADVAATTGDVSRTFANSGTFNYHCAIHSFSGTVVVH